MPTKPPFAPPRGHRPVYLRRERKRSARPYHERFWDRDPDVVAQGTLASCLVYAVGLFFFVAVIIFILLH